MRKIGYMKRGNEQRNNKDQGRKKKKGMPHSKLCVVVVIIHTPLVVVVTVFEVNPISRLTIGDPHTFINTHSINLLYIM